MTAEAVYSIKDLENFSGIKAHTIRIWEKRYKVLEPKRTDTNIRYYDILALQKLLNITLLHNHGYKISVISGYAEEKITAMVLEILSDKNVKNHAINSFLIAMLEFDQQKFLSKYDDLLSTTPFRDIFNDIIVPLLNRVGVLWQTNSISIAHEHFISLLIRQKLMMNIDAQQRSQGIADDNVFVLFLPHAEMNDFGLLYMHYEILVSGRKSLYLGGGVSSENLAALASQFPKITYVSYLGLLMSGDEVNAYIAAFSTELLKSANEWWITGSGISMIPKEHPNAISVVPDFAAFRRRL